MTIKPVRLFILGLGLMLMPAATSAQATEESLSLQQALQFALEHNAEVRQAAYDQEISEYQIKEIRSSGLPQIEAEGQFQGFPNLPTQLLPGEIVGMPGTQIPVQFGTTYNTSGTIKASQLLYSQELFSGLKAAKDSRELYALLKIKSEEDLIYQVASAYYQSLEIEAQIRSLDSNLLTLDKMSKVMLARYQNEMITANELDRITVQKTNLATQLQSLLAVRDQQVNYLKLLMGLPITAELSLREPLDLEDLSLSLASYESQSPIELKILEKQKTLNLRNLEVTRAGYYPTLALFGQQSWQAQRNEFNFFDGNQPWFQQTVIGVQLQVPIFDGGSKHHKIQQNQLQIDKLQLQKDYASSQLDLQTENARKQLQYSFASVSAQADNKELARKVYEQSQQMYQEEVIGLTELLDAEQAFRSAQTNYYNEVLKFKRSELDLLKSLGRIQQILQNT